jgi:hypothetical protein
MMELPKSGNKHLVVESTQPEDLSWDRNFATKHLSWSGWTNAAKTFNFQMMHNCTTMEAWIAQKAVAGSQLW